MQVSRAAAAAALLVLSGCGYIGEPLPPLANIPGRVTDLAAVQRAGVLIVQFTPPQLTTEGVAIKRGVKLDLRAGPAAAPFREEEWLEHAVAAGPSATVEGHARYEIPVAAWAGREVVIAVRVTGANGRSAGWSNFLVVPVVAPPPQPGDVRAEAVPEGIRVSWQASGAAFRVFRRGGETPLAAIANTTAPAWTDGSVETGQRYTYSVQTIVRTGEREAESELSAEISAIAIDLMPPAVPGGLRAVASTASIELAWDPNGEADLAGYRVYRALAGGEFQKLGDVTGGPAFSDRSAEPGKTWRYAVSAFDRAGNESRRCDPVESARP